MLDMEKCHPVELDDLVRVGSDFDGGYVLSERMIEKTKILLSFGVNDNWTFEEDFFNRKNVSIYAYDYSIKSEFFVSKNTYKEKIRDCIGGIIGSIGILSKSRLERHFRELKECINKYNEFKNFFNQESGRYFIPKFIGAGGVGVDT
jgi:hypothetical protein